MTTKEVADKYIEKYRELTKTANRNGLFLLVVILFSWIYLIENLNAQYLRAKKKALLADREIGYSKKVIKSRIRKIENSDARYIYGFSVINQANFDTTQIKETIDSLQGKTGTGNLNYISGLNQKIAKLNNSIPSSTADTTREDILRNRLKQDKDAKLAKSRALLDSFNKLDSLNLDGKVNLDSTSSRIAEDLTKDIPFPFKTMFYFTNNLSNGPKTIILLMAGLIGYLFYCRQMAYRYLTKAIRMYKSDKDAKLSRYYDLTISAPFWLAPVPCKTNYPENRARVQSGDIQKVLNWNHVDHRYRWAVVLSFIVVMGIEIRLIYLSYQYSKAQPVFSYNLNILFFIFTLVLAIYWMLPCRIPDEYNNDPEKKTMDRRAAVLIMGSFFLYPLIRFENSRARRWMESSTRFRHHQVHQKTVPKRLKEGIYINANPRKPGDRKIHYIDATGFSPSFNYARNSKEKAHFMNNLTLLDDSSLNAEKIIKQITHKNLSWHAEKIALYFLKFHKPLEALKMLDYALIINRQDYRIYDLFHRIYVYYLMHDLVAQAMVAERKKESMFPTWGYRDNRVLAQYVRYQNQEWIESVRRQPEFVWGRKHIEGPGLYFK